LKTKYKYLVTETSNNHKWKQ